MDSVSQIVLGAAVAAAVMPKLPTRAMAYGAVLGTLPDLDVLLLRHLDPLRQFTEHRSFSHSLPVLFLLAPMLAFLSYQFDRGLGLISRWRWFLLVWLVLLTHPLLDAFTVYGTQLWWPLASPPVMWASVFIIDPLYTLPLLLACLWIWRGRAQPLRVRRAALFGLSLSSAYLGWSLLAQQLALDQARAALLAEGRTEARLLVSPAPFTTLLWRAVAVDADADGEAYVSLRPGAAAPRWRWTPAEARAKGAAMILPAGQKLHWFTHGFMRVIQAEHQLQIADLRMGADGDYFFVFAIAEPATPGWQPIEPLAMARPKPRLERLAEIFAHF
ncbi:metal-dependent hydrolase [Pseudomarimonas arenosa]|uniref:Metal-dependent hydrolase n=1 Tax=Pseudomarimonas arenosa TaxID=2774145 RepID=A0AAW3ZL72_9GAMM|nr:metal-dependent hydrolase [Pseudomarimonas arenosa]MBD8526860.1 metal-dependent hydrolase [Pseudomarimonas arenosa]